MISHEFLHDSTILKYIDSLQCKTQYIKVIVLNRNEQPLRAIEGRATGGSININANSVVRRSCNLTLVTEYNKRENDNLNIMNEVTNIESLISINKRVAIEIGIENSGDKYKDYNIFWFPLGVYIIQKPSVKYDNNGIIISLSLIDKMALLNGNSGGVFTSPTIFSPIDIDDGLKKSVSFKELVDSIAQQWLSQNNTQYEIDIPAKNRAPVTWQPGEQEKTLTKNIDNSFTTFTVETNWGDGFKSSPNSIAIEEEEMVAFNILIYNFYKKGEEDKTISFDKDLYLEINSDLAIRLFSSYYAGDIYYMSPSWSIELHPDIHIYLADSFTTDRTNLYLDSSGWGFENEEDDIYYGLGGSTALLYIPKNTPFHIIWLFASSTIPNINWPILSNIFYSTYLPISFSAPTTIKDSNSQSFENKLITIKFSNFPCILILNDIQYTYSTLQFTTNSKLFQEEDLEIKNKVLTFSNGINQDSLFRPYLNNSQKMSFIISNNNEKVSRFSELETYALYKKYYLDNKTNYIWNTDNQNPEECTGYYSRSKISLTEGELVNYTALEILVTYTFEGEIADLFSNNEIPKTLHTVVIIGKGPADGTSMQFYNCPNLKKIVLYNGCSFKPTNMMGHTGISHFIIPGGVEQIPSGCFTYSELKTITIPNSITSFIDNPASPFDQCPLTDIYYLGTKEEWYNIENVDIIPESVTIHFAYQNKEFCGYKQIDFTYPRDSKLTAQAGETVTSILDKIKNTLGNYEYYFDVNGIFHFKEIKNYLNEGSSKEELGDAINEKYFSIANKDKVVYEFTNNYLITSYNNNPNYQMIKNDFNIWGRTSDTKQLLWYHLLFMKLPEKYKYLYWEKNESIYKEYNEYPQTVFLTDKENGTKIEEKVEGPKAAIYKGEGVIPAPQKEGWYLIKVIKNKIDLEAKTEIVVAGRRLLDATIEAPYEWFQIWISKTFFENDVWSGIVIDTSNCTVEWWEWTDGFQDNITDKQITKLNTNSDWRRKIYYLALAKEENERTAFDHEIIANLPQMCDLNTGAIKKDAEYFVDVVDTGDLLLMDKVPIKSLDIDSIGQQTLVIQDEKINCFFSSIEYDNLDYNFVGNAQEVSDFNIYFAQTILDNYLIDSASVENPAYDALRREIHNYLSYNENINITCMPIYHLDVNQRIRVDNDESDIHGDYIIKSISLPLSIDGMMTINAQKAIERI